MILTFFYMIATSIQSWRLSSLRTRLNAILQGASYTCPSIMLYTKSLQHGNRDSNIVPSVQGNQEQPVENFLSSHLCLNKTLAKLGDLIWCHGDINLCTIHPQQKVDVSDWLAYPHGKTIFPMYAHNYNQVSIGKDSKMSVLVEADFEIFRPLASTIAIKLEEYGLITMWTADKNFNIILETDLDHITKFTTAVMQGQSFINNGFLLTRIESVLIQGKPCMYNNERVNSLPEKKLVGKAQWDAYVKKLKLLTSTAKLASQQNTLMEVTGMPGVVISPGCKTLSLDPPITPEFILLNDTTDGRNSTNFPVPSTPPPTPASISTTANETESLLSQSIMNSEVTNTTMPQVPDSTQIAAQESNEPDNTEKIKDIIPENVSEVSVEIVETFVETSKPSSTMAFEASILQAPSPSKYAVQNVPTITCTKSIKPQNILIYADSAVALQNIKNVLETTLCPDRYTIYPLKLEEAKSNVWMQHTALLVVCGNVGGEIGAELVEYFVQGGKLLVLCSDMLHILLPSFKTAEVRENELVHFSYKKWKHVRMMHHIFCYQASPVKTRFSQDHEDIKTSVIHPPSSAKIKDKVGKAHTFGVEVLGTEETWHTPSIILANLTATGGKAVFSQIHLEADPAQYELEEKMFSVLKESNAARLEIFNDLLSVHLGLDVDNTERAAVTYSHGYFLGRHELKLEMLERLKNKMKSTDILKLPKLEVQFCGRDSKVQQASASFLPIMIHQCPDNFSTVEYFENLNTKEIGRLLIYADVMASTMRVTDTCRLQHGLAVIARQQTNGVGRGRNMWLSPKGSASFTLQLHIPCNSPLGKRISLLQHLVAVAIVSGIRSVPGLEGFDLRLKWPNDIFVSNQTKICGMMTTAHIESEYSICNIGVGLNLSNSLPTISINGMIKDYNEKNKTKLPTLSVERYMALVFTEMENLLNIVQSGNMKHLFEMYYTYWLHTDARVTVLESNGKSQDVKILGIDEYGFLQVQGTKGDTFSVHPDGNSFDLLRGLIIPK